MLAKAVWDTVADDISFIVNVGAVLDYLVLKFTNGS